MRFIVAFLFVGALTGQVRPEFGEAIDRLENTVAQNPENLQARTDLLQRYTNLMNGGLANASGPTLNQVVEARRGHLLWLIEHHPDAQVLGGALATIDPVWLRESRGTMAEAVVRAW